MTLATRRQSWRCCWLSTECLGGSRKGSFRQTACHRGTVVLFTSIQLCPGLPSALSAHHMEALGLQALLEGTERGKGKGKASMQEEGRGPGDGQGGAEVETASAPLAFCFHPSAQEPQTQSGTDAFYWSGQHSSYGVRQSSPNLSCIPSSLSWEFKTPPEERIVLGTGGRQSQD